VIAAAGSGERLGAGGPKAFVELAGRSLLEWSLAAFDSAKTVGEVIVAAPPGEESRVTDLGLVAVTGGAHRTQSVINAVGLASAEIVVVHDAARPLVTPGLIDAIVGELAAEDDAAAVIAAAPVSDTIKEASPDGEVSRTLDRSSLWSVQTPQAFRADALRDALRADESELAAATDEAMLVEARGGKVLIHSTPPVNMKVTTPFDLRVAELLLRERG
jgi:2-C-methyl-D-erythritol 4-phosphate cytidylyltransferase